MAAVFQTENENGVRMGDIQVEVDDSVFGLTALVTSERPFEQWRDFPIHDPSKCLGYWALDFGETNTVTASVQKDPFYGEEIRFVVYLSRYYITTAVHERIKELFEDKDPTSKKEGMRPKEVQDFLTNILVILRTAST
ncbi:hypothetical protein [Sicyoidochytrium minutum DNA virus]|nr:hypothetical protein [Sicyoidochytrium minutum DNA virus]